MARIRTIKPDFFRHECLYNAEIETGLPLRVAFAGLWSVCDREGRFRWKPKELKLDVLPFDDLDFERVLDALTTRGFLVKYENQGKLYGCVPSFKAHQVVNNKEKDSILPSHNDQESKIQTLTDAISTRTNRDSVATVTRLNPETGEGKGREQEQEQEGKGVPVPLRVPDAKPGAKCFEQYQSAYVIRYGTEPVRNAKVNALFVQLVKRIGDVAPQVSEFYVFHNNALYVRSGHAVDLLVRDCEKLHTEWITGNRITETKARQADRKDHNLGIAEALLSEERGKHV